MRKGFAISLIATLLFGGGFFYYIAEAVCPVPLTYRVGEIDDRFDITEEEARLALSEAESIWEDATGRNLFTYDENGKLVVSFVYDERQEFVEEETELKDKLDATENISEAISDTYASLIEEYNTLKLSYADKVEAYERKLNTYNEKVEQYNKEGGAPSDVYSALSAEKEALNREQRELNTLASKLNDLVSEINNIGERGNKLINSYNQGVETYNEKFGESHEFTQGDYSNSTIKIYTFEDDKELELVLVHEFGHALSLEHVEGPASMMYYLIGEQPVEAVLSKEDLQEFDRVCGEKSIVERLQILLSSRKS
jgi:chromosome segregation ATPase